jgi:hypothetical protein
MKRLVLGALLLSCAGYDNNDLQLSVGHAARDACTCTFVMEQDEAFCQAWLKAKPAVTRWSVDRQAKTSEASAFMVWSAKARFVGPRFGCVLE